MTTNLQREKKHKKDCDMYSNVGIPKSQKDDSYCTCGKKGTVFSEHDLELIREGRAMSDRDTRRGV